MRNFDWQAAIQQTEQAIDRQKAVLASSNDPVVAKISRRSLDTLEDMLRIQQLTYGLLMKTGGDGAPSSYGCSLPDADALTSTSSP